jgi:uncharacterized membrane protein (UPF0127 family)
VVCALELTESRRERARGLRGRPGCDWGLLAPGGRLVHTFGMKFALDVALLGPDLEVVRLVRMPPWRVTVPRRGVRSVLQAEAGSLERWGVRQGDQLVIREAR